MEHFGLAQYFEMICGATLDGSRSHKADVIEYLLKQTGDMQNIVMVGDTSYDVTGASAHGIPCIGVAWGYGLVQDMLDAGAVAIAETAEQLLELLEQ